MILEVILAVFFLVTIISQYQRRKEIVVFERKTTGIYIVITIGCFILFGITWRHGYTIIHLLTGLLAIVMLIGSIFVTGMSEEHIFYYVAPKKWIGKKVTSSDAKNIRIENDHPKKIIVRFVVYSSEKILTFSKEDAEKVKELLDYNFSLIHR